MEKFGIEDRDYTSPIYEDELFDSLKRINYNGKKLKNENYKFNKNLIN